ncbi:hypothetical protein BURMUCF1_0713 [Burkholderia multivorans ATCC BAA-247]|nr:hypothetical protein BURMUCGD1_2543 [Burkholderia multivorans CGD1]EJO61231.1 hypothetical protein BURMUCF1_0713 [Burkholderia multivorans ATCC BAA-247]
MSFATMTGKAEAVRLAVVFPRDVGLLQPTSWQREIRDD